MLFIEFIKRNKKQFIKLVFLTISYALLGLPAPYISRFLIDDVFANKNLSFLPNIIIAFTVIIVFQMIFGRYSSKAKASFFRNFLQNIQSKVFDAYITNMGTPIIDNQRFQTMITSDSELLSSNYLQITEVVFSNGIYFIGYSLILLFISFKLFLITLFFVPIYIFWTLFYAKKMKIFAEKGQVAKENIIHSIFKATVNYLPIKIYDYILPINKEYDSVIKKNGENTENLINYQNIIGIVANIIVILASFIPLFVGIMFVESNELTLGEIIAFNSYSVQLFTPLTSIISLLSTVNISKVYETRLINFINEIESYNVLPKIEKNSSNDVLEIKKFKLFSQGNNLLEISNFHLKKSQFIRIIGENGTGKTLLLKSIANLYQGFSGKIFIKGLSNKNLYYENWKDNVIYIDSAQSFPLKNIKDELTDSKNVDDSEIEEMLDIVSLKEKVQNLKYGLYTTNEYILNNFSNGELQRYRLARALIRKPKLLLLDEIFSNIDNYLTTKIIAKIKKNFPDLTIIFIEHKIDVSIRFDGEFLIGNNTLSKYSDG